MVATVAEERTAAAPPTGRTHRTLAEQARRLPPGRNGRPVHVATLTRWIVDGVRLSDGSRLRLQADRLPGRWVVSDEAMAEFIAALTADRSPAGNVAGQPNPAPASVPAAAGAGPLRGSLAQRRERERVARELDRAGITAR